MADDSQGVLKGHHEHDELQGDQEFQGWRETRIVLLLRVSGAGRDGIVSRWLRACNVTWSIPQDPEFVTEALGLAH